MKKLKILLPIMLIILFIIFKDSIDSWIDSWDINNSTIFIALIINFFIVFIGLDDITKRIYKIENNINNIDISVNETQEEINDMKDKMGMNRYDSDIN